jgi:ribonuclease PH
VWAGRYLKTPPLVPCVTEAALTITSLAAPTHVDTTTSAWLRIEMAAISSAADTRGQRGHTKAQVRRETRSCRCGE